MNLPSLATSLAQWAVAAVLLAGCATPPATDPATIGALDGVLAAEHRSAENRARDAHRHPKETLQFFGLRQDMTVVEVWPGAGWYTEILAPLLRDRGQLYAAVLDANSGEYAKNVVETYRNKLQLRPDLYGKVTITTLAAPPAKNEIAPPGSADLVVTFRNLHNWPQDPKAASGYVNEEHAIRLVEAAGFRLVARSQINANPKDTKDYEKGVWTLPPGFADGDEARYRPIGESDRFTLKFVKVAK
jgi:predicted methyltransferase